MAYEYKVIKNNKILRAIDIKKFGSDDSIQSGSFQDLWTGGEVYQAWDHAADKPRLIVAAGDVGVELTIQGQDADGYFQTETLLSTSTDTDFTKDFSGAIPRAWVSGSQVPTADIEIRYQDNVLAAHVPYDANQTLQLFWVVPRGFHAICKGFRFNIGKGKDATVRQRSRAVGEIWRTQDTMYLYENSIDYPCKIHNIIPEMTQITFEANGGGTGIPLAGVAEFTLVENDIIDGKGTSYNPNG